jgi:hypothetical protein
MNNTKVTKNNSQQLYVIPCGKNAFSCLGYDVLIDKRNSLAAELNRQDLTNASRGTLKAYNEYLTLIDIAKQKSASGWKSQTGLTKQLIGLEGKRVEVVTASGTTKRFYVGKSTGWVPCHLEIARKNSTGGGAVYDAPFKSVKVIY